MFVVASREAAGMSLTVAIPDTFSGPLDLLLHLIRRDEMDIHDIPIGQLTNSYLEEMEKLDFVDVDEAAEFLDLASRLLEIKGRMLLPPEEPVDGEEAEEDDFDPRSGLVEALLEYRRFKEAAKMLGDLAEEQERRYPRIAPRVDFGVVEDMASSADSLDLMTAFQSMLLRIVPVEASTEITYTEVPTSVRIRQIEEVLASAGKARFSLLLSEKPTRREMVGFFIAILELVRQGRLIARQTDKFSDIVLEKAEPRRMRPVRPGAPLGMDKNGVSRGTRSAGKARFPAFSLFPPLPDPRRAGKTGAGAVTRNPPAFLPVAPKLRSGKKRRAPSRVPRFFC